MGAYGGGRGIARDRTRARDGGADDRERGSRRDRVARGRRRGPLPGPDRIRPPTRSRPRGAPCSASFPIPGEPRGRPFLIGTSAAAPYGTRRRVFGRASAASGTVRRAGPRRSRRTPAITRGRAPGICWRSPPRLADGPPPPALVTMARRLTSRIVSDELGRLAAGGPVLPAVDRIRALIAGDPIAGDRRSIFSGRRRARAIQAALGRLLPGPGPGATAENRGRYPRAPGARYGAGSAARSLGSPERGDAPLA